MSLVVRSCKAFHLRQLSAVSSFGNPNGHSSQQSKHPWAWLYCVTGVRNQQSSFATFAFGSSDLVKPHFELNNTVCSFATKTAATTSNTFDLSDDACPQGIQGEDCVNFKLWLENCKRYGLANCMDQLQGIQSGRKTIAEVIAEQDKLIASIAEEYRELNKRKGDAQGIQDNFSAFPDVNSPCPQGVQGSDCARFKLWLENCHRFGLHDCLEQYESFVGGRKTLAEIFIEQDNLIREAATVAFQQRRRYSTSSRNNKLESEAAVADKIEETVVRLTQRQRLQRAVKEYGSTVMVFHVTISLMSLGFFYMLVSSGVDVAGILMKLGIAESFLQNKLAGGAGTFVVAYAVHKVFAPVRIATTLTATPFIVRYLRRIGFLKGPVATKPKP